MDAQLLESLLQVGDLFHKVLQLLHGVLRVLGPLLVLALDFAGLLLQVGREHTGERVGRRECDDEYRGVARPLRGAYQHRLGPPRT